jgi:hypothetical protein
LSHCIWLNNILNDQWLKKEITSEIRKCLETNKKEKIISKNMWDSVKAALRGKFIV